ncbi:hypothetical protein QQG55_47695 [Brugia pahangi]
MCENFRFCMILAMKVAYSLFLTFVILWTSVVPKSIGQIEAPLMEPMRYKKWTRLEPSVRFFDKRWTRLEPSSSFMLVLLK